MVILRNMLTHNFFIITQDLQTHTRPGYSRCVLCGGSRRAPPLHTDQQQLPCCKRMVHTNCITKAVSAREDCLGCSFPITVEGFVALEGKHFLVLIYVLCSYKDIQ